MFNVGCRNAAKDAAEFAASSQLCIIRTFGNTAVESRLNVDTEPCGRSRNTFDTPVHSLAEVSGGAQRIRERFDDDPKVFSGNFAVQSVAETYNGRRAIEGVML